MADRPPPAHSVPIPKKWARNPVDPPGLSPGLSQGGPPGLDAPLLPTRPSAGAVSAGVTSAVSAVSAASAAVLTVDNANVPRRGSSQAPTVGSQRTKRSQLCIQGRTSRLTGRSSSRTRSIRTGQSFGSKSSKRKKKIPAPQFTGKLKFFAEDKGFGFITCPETYELYNRDIFVMERFIIDRGDNPLKPGTSVSFAVVLSDRGAPQARGVILGDPPEDLSPRPPKKTLYAPYMSLKEVEEGLETGLIVKGTLRVHATKRTLAFVRTGTVSGDVIVEGMENRNRAFNGDVVAVRLGPPIGEDEPLEADEVEEDSLTDDEEDDEDEDDVSGTAVGKGSRKDSVLSVFRTEDAEADPAEQAPQPEQVKLRGTVVHIFESEARKRGFVCTLTNNRSTDVEEREVTMDDTMIKAVPLDQRIPWILLQINDDVRRVLKLPGQLDKYEFWYVEVLKWDETAALPLGKLGKERLGKAGTVEAEIKAAICEHGLMGHDEDFSDECLNQADDIVGRTKEYFAEECSNRQDLRHTERVFTIDPATAKDLDDAIHIRRLGKNILEVGVHIADVGHFVKSLSPIDVTARSRCTSVYMPDRVFPMLPHALCNYLCSLNPDEDKLTFSTFFRIDMATGALLRGENRAWFAKTVICSCCRLNYDEVQGVLDGKEIDAPPVTHPKWRWSQIQEDIFTLYDVCGKVRQKRFSDGGLMLHKTKMVFHTRGTNDGIPKDYHLESHSASHWIIEELMLLANKCVAEFSCQPGPLQYLATLRCHMQPDPQKAEELAVVLGKSGVKWNRNTAKDILKSLEEAERHYGEFVARTLEILVMRCGMKPATYFIFGSKSDNDDEQISPHHYALNFDHYTHFTSPIRRYADVMVHRVLHAILKKQDPSQFLAEVSGKQVEWTPIEEEDDDSEDFGDEEPAQQGKNSGGILSHQSREVLVAQCKRCNDMKKQAKEASEMADRAFFCMYLRARDEFWYTNAAVLHIEVRKGKFIIVYSPQLGKEKKISLTQEVTDKVMVGDRELSIPKRVTVKSQTMLELCWALPGSEEEAKEEPVDDLSEEEEEDEGAYHVQTVTLFMPVPVVLVPVDTVPIDYEMFFLSPFDPRFADLEQEVRVKKSFNEWAEED